MKRLLLILSILTIAAGATRAQNTGEVGVGFNLGDTMGGTAKYWIDQYSALDVAMGAASDNGKFVIYGDYLYHGWKAFPQPKSGKLAAYVGAGPRIKAGSDDTEFGVRGIVGASFWVPKHPLEIYAEIGPLIRMAPDTAVKAVGGLGLRYYFKNWN